jgi:lipopolysaccharide export system protein LptC
MDSNRFPVYFPLALLALLSAMAFWLDQKVQTPAAPRDKKAQHDPDYIVQKFSAMQMSPAGTVRRTLTAEKLTHYADDGSSYLVDPKLVQYKEGEAPVRITADAARVTEEGEHAHFIGNVRAVAQAKGTGNDIKVLTDYLHVIPDQDYAKTDKPVTITSGTSVTHAIGMELNSDTRVVKLLSSVKVRYEGQKRTNG